MRTLSRSRPSPLRFKDCEATRLKVECCDRLQLGPTESGAKLRNRTVRTIGASHDVENSCLMSIAAMTASSTSRRSCAIRISDSGHPDSPQDRPYPDPGRVRHVDQRDLPDIGQWADSDGPAGRATGRLPREKTVDERRTEGTGWVAGPVRVLRVGRCRVCRRRCRGGRKRWPLFSVSRRSCGVAVSTPESPRVG